MKTNHNNLTDNEVCSSQAREVLKHAENAEGEVTVDMVAARMKVHEKAAWILRSASQQ